MTAEGYWLVLLGAPPLASAYAVDDGYDVVELDAPLVVEGGAPVCATG